MVKVKVRGVYTTALTKLLLGRGFEIVQPSIYTQKRFDLKKDDSPSELNVYDRLDRQGVQALGEVEAIDALYTVLRESLFDAVIRRSGARQLSITIMGRDVQLLDAEFPWLSKIKLDIIRGSITPTVKGHHYYKACGASISSVVDMAERLIDRGRPIDEVEELLKLTIRAHYPVDGCEINMKHVKLDGGVFHLGRALVEVYDEKKGLIKLCRIIKGRGMYDGLEIPKEPGDYAITEAKLGEWYLRTRYFSYDGRYKGMYINVNTPIELYPRWIRYVDLEVDVCIEPEGKARVVDEERLEEAAKKGVISKNLLCIVRRKIEEFLPAE
ncbi:MAG: DUF402 domain-containing protein [archaeon]|nr:DUF402 domain-containing protein [archaeon]MCP8305512.1 DUF402 domain-containing protein [archaeon]